MTRAEMAYSRGPNALETTAAIRALVTHNTSRRWIEAQKKRDGAPTPIGPAESGIRAKRVKEAS